MLAGFHWLCIATCEPHVQVSLVEPRLSGECVASILNIRCCCVDGRKLDIDSDLSICTGSKPAKVGNVKEEH